MKALTTIFLATVAAHLVGSMVLFGILCSLTSGIVSGLEAVLLAPMLSIFGWFFLVPEVVGASVQWFVYRHSERKKRIGFLLVSAVIAGAIVAAFGPKEQGSEMLWTLAYALAAGLAAIVSGAIIQFAKTPKIPLPRVTR